MVLGTSLACWNAPEVCDGVSFHDDPVLHLAAKVLYAYRSNIRMIWYQRMWKASGPTFFIDTFIDGNYLFKSFWTGHCPKSLGIDLVFLSLCLHLSQIRWSSWCAMPKIIHISHKTSNHLWEELGGNVLFVTNCRSVNQEMVTAWEWPPPSQILVKVCQLSTRTEGWTKGPQLGHDS